MRNLPFDQPGRFWKGNLHTHSTRSDGTLTPAEVVAGYRERGYDFLALTDHFHEHYGFPITDTRPFQIEDFTTLLGAELHAPQIEVGDPWHILAVGLPPEFAPTGAAGAFVGIAHPAWYGLTPADALSLEAAHAVEIYNETCRWLNDRAESWHLTDGLLARGRRLLAFAADDAHFAGRPDAYAAWVHVRAERLEPAALLAALLAGHFYSSQGPAITEVAVAGSTIGVTCSPVRAVFVSGRAAAAHRLLGHSITSAELSLEPFKGGYCRVTVVDDAGRRAWTNPIWLDA
jgi:hypothetical protein